MDIRLFRGSVNKLLKNMIAGMGTILVIAPTARADTIDARDYMHESSEDAMHSDWVRVGQELTKAAESKKQIDVSKNS